MLKEAKQCERKGVIEEDIFLHQLKDTTPSVERGWIVWKERSDRERHILASIEEYDARC